MQTKTFFIGVSLILLITISSSLNSCSHFEKTKLSKEQIDSVRTDSLWKAHNKRLDTVNIGYKIKSYWDDLNYHYTIQFDTITMDSFQCLRGPDIIDIYRKDTALCLSVYVGLYSTYYIDLVISQSQADTILRMQKDEKLSLIVSIKCVRKMKVPIELSAEKDENDNAIVSFGEDDIPWNATNDEVYFCNGTLIQIVK